MIADGQTEKIMDIHCIAANASELINLAAFAISKRSTLRDLANLAFAHPTFSEAIKEAYTI